MKTHWFTFTKAERRGIFVLMVLLVFLVLLPKSFPLFIKKEEPPNWEEKYAEFVAQQNEQVADKTQSLIKKSTSPKKTNTSQKIEKTLEEPKEKEVKVKTEREIEKREVVKKPVVIDINTASAQDFAKLHGIGEVFSNRIVKFRDGLGGFVSVNQVGDTYGIEPDLFQSIKGQLVVSPNFSPVKINLNQASVNELKRNPYISEKLAAQIVNYREKVHPFKTEEDVKSLYFMSDELYKKLHAYLVW